METQGPGSNPTPEEAREALRMADAEEAATVNRPVPWWYFPALAVLILAQFLLNAVDDPSSPIRVLVAVLAVGIGASVAALVYRVSFTQPGYRGVRTPWRSMIAGMLAAGTLAVVPVLLADQLGNWIWIVCGVLLSGLIAGFGTAYWLRYPRG